MAPPEQTDAPQRPWMRRIPTVLGAVLTIASVVGTVLALLGYGVAHAVQGRLGLPISTVFASTLDLFNLGGWAVVQVLATASQWESWDFYAGLWRQIWSHSLRVIGYALVLGSIPAAFAALRCAGRGWVKRDTTASKVSRARAFLRNRPKLSNSIAAAAGALIAVVSLPFALLAGLLVLVLFCFMLAAIPLMGLAAGESYIDDWVVRPTVCTPVLSRDARLQTVGMTSPKSASRIYGVPCIAVTRSDGQVERGRLVFGTANAVILYDPVSGSARRIGTEGNKLEVIGQL